MNVVTTRNQVEQALVTAFEEASEHLPGGGDVRRAAISRFGATGLPHRRIEEWKYTDLRNLLQDVPPPSVGDAGVLTDEQLLAALGPFAQLDADRVVFVDGRHQASLDQTVKDAIAVSSLAKTLKSDASSVSKLLADRETMFRGSSVVDLNTAFSTDGAQVTIAPGTKLSKPLLIVHVAQNHEAVATTVRHKIVAGEGAEACVVEVFVKTSEAGSGGLTNTVSEVEVGDGATLHHVKCVNETAARHLVNWHVTIGADANYRAFHLTAGSPLSRSDGLIQFRGEHAKLDFSGAFLGRGSDHIDTTLMIEHLVPHCESRELFKGVLDDRARGIFQGKVLVAQAAQKTDGKQMAQALMLSPDTEFDSKPELEIYADDVLCGHGSTSAELDDDLLFYLRSRGIPKDQARALLIESFVGEALERVEIESVRDTLTEVARQWLVQV